MASFLPPAVIEIKAVADKAIAEFKQVNGELDKMEKNAEKAGGGVAKMEKASKLATGALIGMGTAFAGFAAIGIKEALEAEVIMNKLGATMTAVGVNTDKNREAVQKLTSSYIDLGFADEEAAAGFENLLRVTGDVDQAQRLLALSADLARTKNISLSQAATTLARASQGNARAFKEAGIALDTTLPKAEAIDKAFDQLNARIGTQAENATKTFAVQLQIVKERFSDTAETLGATLLPYLKQLLESINNAIEFVKRNSTAFKIFGGIILTVTAALAAYNLGVKASIAVTKVWTAITKAQQIATAVLTGQQKALNVAMKANPIGLIVSGVTLLIGGFVMLWNKSEMFRKIMIAIGKAGLTAFAAIIRVLGKVGETLLKVVFAPLKAVLTALSKLPGVGKYAKAGLDLLNKGLDGVSNFADSAANKVEGFRDKLDKLNKPIKIGGGKGIEIPDLGKGTGKGVGGGLDPKEKKELQKKNEEYLKIVKELNDKRQNAIKKYQDDIAKATERYDETNLKAHAKYAEDLLNAEKNRDKAIFKANEDARKRTQAAQEAFNSTMGKLNQERAENLAKLESDNAKRIADITKAGQDKLQSIIQQSIDRLRDAYKRGTEFSVTDLFKGLVEAGKTSADELLNVLRTRLADARKLAENASKLVSLGFTQTFVEQVVAAGPEVGNQLAESILQATPDTIRELQKTYMALEDTSDSGLDKLASSMNNGANFATAQLAEAYYQAQQDTKIALAELNAEYLDSQREINRAFNESMLEAERTRDTAIAEASADLAEAIKEINAEFTESVAQINKELTDALAESAKELSDATAEAQRELNETLDEIAKEFDEKLGKVKGAISSTMREIASLKAAIASMQSATAVTATAGKTTVTSSIVPLGKATAPKTTTPKTTSPADFRRAEEASMAPVVVQQTFNTDYVDPIQVKTQMLAAMKYGSTVQVAGGGGSGRYGMLVT
jgi:DNA anti-recombination protein RmuC